MKLTSIALTAMLLIGLTAPARAQILITAADTDAILEAAKTIGSATLINGLDGDPIIEGKTDDVIYQIYLRNCTNNADCEDLNFYTGFAGTKPDLEKINDWNRDKRFGRAYLDADSDAAVEMDIDLVQGVSAEYLNAEMTLWRLVISQFAAHIGYK